MNALTAADKAISLMQVAPATILVSSLVSALSALLLHLLCSRQTGLLVERKRPVGSGWLAVVSLAPRIVPGT